MTTVNAAPRAYGPSRLLDWAADVSLGHATRLVIEGPTASGRTKAIQLARKLLARRGVAERHIAMLTGLDLDSSIAEGRDAWWGPDHRAIIIDDADFWVEGMDYFGDFRSHDSDEWCDDRRRALAYAMDDLRGIRDKAVLITIRDQASLESAVGHAALPWADVERISLPAWRAPAGVVRHQISW